jgi:hypothetical protein
MVLSADGCGRVIHQQQQAHLQEVEYQETAEQERQMKNSDETRSASDKRPGKKMTFSGQPGTNL